VSSLIQTPKSLSQVGHWQGDLYLQFTQAGKEPLVHQEPSADKKPPPKTIMAKRRHSGPFTVQRPFYPEGEVCHTILLHPPGGLVEGDILNLRVDCEPQAHSFIVTPSAGKVYECSKHAAAQRQVLNIADGGKLEWFPQEMILYDRSISELETSIHLHGNAQFAGWEMVCFGRPIAEDHFTTGTLQQCLSIYRDDQPVLIERTVIDASHGLMESRSGLAGFKGMASFFMTGANKQHLETANEVVDKLTHESSQQNELPTELSIGITLIDDILVARVLMNQSRYAKQALTAIWSSLRHEILEKTACKPRIWAT